MNELEQLTALFLCLGAPATSAGVMAAQLLKRAGQLASERKISREDALAQLVKRVLEARSGSVTPDLERESG